MFNQTTEELVFVVWDREYAVAPGGFARFPLSYSFEVRSSKGIHEYVYPDGLPFEESRQYLEMSYWKGRVMKMEIRPDYVIYILPAVATAPGAAPYAQQRKGFPVVGRLRK